MRFNFFTRPSTYASKRLRFTGRGMQVFGVLAGAVRFVAFYSLRTVDLHIQRETLDLVLRRMAIDGVVTTAAYLIIGRALLQRQRWAAYAAIATIGAPTAMRFARPMTMFDEICVVIAVITLTLIASVWHELGSVVDSEFVEHGAPPPPEEPLTPRNRGYGEALNAPLQRSAEPVAVVESDQTRETSITSASVNSSIANAMHLNRERE